MEDRRPKTGELYRHFKNKMYQIVGIATHSETKEELVIYQALYGDYGIYARPLAMFVSEVDHVKYPEVTQKYRFEKVERRSLQENDGKKEAALNGAGGMPQKQQEEAEEEQPDSRLMNFLNQDTFEGKLNYLTYLRGNVDDKLIDAMAASIDVTVPEGDIESRYMSLKNCVSTYAKYECNR